MRLDSRFWRVLAKPFRTIRAIVAYQLRPMPLDEFADYDEYWSKRDNLPPGYVFRRWEVAAEAMAEEGRVLAVGCGRGGFLAYLKQRRPRLQIAGCDVSPAAVEQTRQLGFPAFVHDIETTPLPETYDYVACLDVLEHVAHAERAFKYLKGNFRKKLIVSVPNFGCLRCRVRLALFGKFPLTNCIFHVNEHLRHWTISDFRYWMKRESMRILRIDGQYGLRGFYRWFPGLFAHGVVFTLERAEDSATR